MEEINYQEGEIKRLLFSLNGTYDHIHGLRQAIKKYKDEFEGYEELDWYVSDFKNDSKKLYLTCLAYFEQKNLISYLQKFTSTLFPYFEDDEVLLKGTYDNDTGEAINNFTVEIEILLHPFSRLSLYENKFLIEKTGILYLEHILESTAVIIKELDKHPTSETQVYNSVKLLCKSTFKDAKFPSESFQKTAKCYIPDILIPSLSCAVEYKYAETEQKLIDTIDQILIDVKGYSNHSVYKIFYAVFYVKPGIWSQQRFKTVWDEKEFPKNWNWKMVEGI